MAETGIQEAKLNHLNMFLVSDQKYYTSCPFTFHWPKPIIYPDQQCDGTVHAAWKGMRSYKAKNTDLHYMGAIGGKNNTISYL